MQKIHRKEDKLFLECKNASIFISCKNFLQIKKKNCKQILHNESEAADKMRSLHKRDGGKECSEEDFSSTESRSSNSFEIYYILP